MVYRVRRLRPGEGLHRFSFSACVTEISTGGRLGASRTSRPTTFEDIRNQAFRFVTRSFVNQKLDHEIRGSAEADTDGLSVTIEQPEELALDIAPAHFPTEHMIEMIDKAPDGGALFTSRASYDGSDEGDQAMITLPPFWVRRKTVDSTD